MKNNERLNMTVVVGLFLLALGLLWANSATDTPAEIKKDYANIITTLSGGLIGFLARSLVGDSSEVKITDSNNNVKDE